MNNFNLMFVKILVVLCMSVALMLSSNAFAAKPYKIGDTGPGGGIVFHVTDDGKHGLEAAQTDQSGDIQWFNWDYIQTGAAKSGVNGGSFNTDRIISNQGYGDYAALLAANYNGGGYGDWYLPSKDELNLMYINLHLAGLGGFADEGYWSSTEADADSAWVQGFGFGIQGSIIKVNTMKVRAIRAF